MEERDQTKENTKSNKQTRFPKESLSEQRKISDEGDDQRGPLTEETDAPPMTDDPNARM